MAKIVGAHLEGQLTAAKTSSSTLEEMGYDAGGCELRGLEEGSKAGPHSITIWWVFPLKELPINPHYGLPNYQHLDVCYTESIGCHVIEVRDTCPLPYVSFLWENPETQRRGKEGHRGTPNRLHSKVRTQAFPYSKVFMMKLHCSQREEN